MADATTAAVTVPAVVGIGAAALLPGIDINAVIGAFAGAMLFVVHAKDLKIKTRIGFMLASWIFGYYIAAELISRDYARTSGLAAFFGGLVCVAICAGIIEWLQGGNAPAWLRWLLRNWTGRRNE